MIAEDIRDVAFVVAGRVIKEWEHLKDLLTATHKENSQRFNFPDRDFQSLLLELNNWNSRNSISSNFTRSLNKLSKSCWIAESFQQKRFLYHFVFHSTNGKIVNVFSEKKTNYFVTGSVAGWSQHRQPVHSPRWLLIDSSAPCLKR